MKFQQYVGIRGALALVIVTTGSVMLVMGQQIPQEAIAIGSIVIGYYFGRTEGNVVNGNNKGDVKNNDGQQK